MHRVVAMVVTAVVAVTVAGGLGSRAADATTLLDHRAWELVSAPNKRGADVLLTSWRTQAAIDGSAFRYAALSGFSDVQGVAVGTDYVSVRSHESDPRSNGWSTHGVMPPERSLSLADLLNGLEPRYVGQWSDDLTTGVYSARASLTDAPAVRDVPNLYRRSDLLQAGEGAYTLLTACPLCDATRTALPPVGGNGGAVTRFERPQFAGASPNFGHMVFESRQRLTADAPVQPALCQHSTFFAVFCRPYVYEWDHGAIYLAGVLPDGTAADASVAGQGVQNGFRTPDVVSDNSDGHGRVFFTQPTDNAGHTASQSGPGTANQPQGNVFVRVDHTVTQQLNESERANADAFRPARFLDASANGRLAFFMTAQALTDDAPADGLQKVYMYDASRPGSDPANLTWINASSDPGAANVIGAIGVSTDGQYFYFVSNGGIYLWHGGTVVHVGPAVSGSNAGEFLGTGFFWTLAPNQTRVTPDGHYLLFPSRSSTVTGYDHGTCGGDRCRELYVFNADAASVVCASCNPGGAPATGSATVDFGGNLIGGTGIELANNRALSRDGGRVFFSSPDALVLEDTNSKIDAYEFDVRSRRVALLSSGRSTADSYFMNASADGKDAFFITRERLVGWDVDDAYDVYDARADGGFPEPVAPVPCSGDACRGLPSPPVGAASPRGSESFVGGGNEGSARGPRHRQRCQKGRVLRHIRGAQRCVRKQRARRRAMHGRRPVVQRQRRAS